MRHVSYTHRFVATLLREKRGTLHCMHLVIVVGFLSAFLSFILDAVIAGILGKTGTIFIIGRFLRLSLSMNPGIAFSIRLPSPLQELLITGALLAVGYAAVRSKPEAMSSAAFGLIFGGAAANLVDRFIDGSVTDFIAVGTFPVFNLADATISVGVGLLLAENLRKNGKKRIK